jgi:hypothetical protein
MSRAFPRTCTYARDTIGVVADTQAKIRDTLIQIALDHRRFRFKSGKINASALASELGVAASTVNRILNAQRNTKDGDRRNRSGIPDYDPSQALLTGIGNLTGCNDNGQIWEYILESRSRGPIEDLLKP